MPVNITTTKHGGVFVLSFLELIGPHKAHQRAVTGLFMSRGWENQPRAWSSARCCSRWSAATHHEGRPEMRWRRAVTGSFGAPWHVRAAHHPGLSPLALVCCSLLCLYLRLCPYYVSALCSHKHLPGEVARSFLLCKVWLTFAEAINVKLHSIRSSVISAHFVNTNWWQGEHPCFLPD